MRHLLLFVLLLALFFLPSAEAQVGVGFEMTPPVGKDKEAPQADPHDVLYVAKLSERLASDKKLLQELQDQGCGRGEMIMLWKIAEKAGKPVTELYTKERQKKKTLASLAKQYGLDYGPLRKEALALRDGIVAELNAMTLDELHAAASAQLRLDSTDYFLQNKQ